MTQEQQPHILDRLISAGKTFRDYDNEGIVTTSEFEAACEAITLAHTLITTIHKTLDGKEWDSDTPSDIADHLKDYGLDIREPDDESGMTADELAEKYAGEAGTWGEHPRFGLDGWRHEVMGGVTRHGYWDWVVSKIEQEG